MYHRKVDVVMLNTVKSVLADVFCSDEGLTLTIERKVDVDMLFSISTSTLRSYIVRLVVSLHRHRPKLALTGTIVFHNIKLSE